MAWHTPTCQGLEILWADGAPSCKRCGSRAPVSDHGGPLEDLPPPPPPPPTKRSQLRCTWPKSVKFVDLPAEQESAILGEIDSWKIGYYKLEESAARTETEDDFQEAAKVDTTETIPKIGELERLDQSLNLQTLYPKIEGSGGIRLLRIFGAAFFGDPLHCGLIVVNLNDPRCPIFEALSYTWADDNGDKSHCKRIYIGPEYHTLPVTRNCDLALRRLRTQLERLVWVDAVCINQEDDLERNTQVALMRQIYSTASRIVVYLGEDANGASVAMDTLASEEGQAVGSMDSLASEEEQDIESMDSLALEEGQDNESMDSLESEEEQDIESMDNVALEEGQDNESMDSLESEEEQDIESMDNVASEEGQDNESMDSLESEEEQDIESMDNVASEEEQDNESIGPEVEDPLLALLTRPYFFRTWVIQEVALAYKATVICGDRIIAWAALEHALHSEWLKNRSEVPPWMAQAWKLDLNSELTDSRLLQLLENTMPCLAGDPRDKIFGILGLVRDKGVHKGLVPDYSLSVQQVYTGVAAYLLEEAPPKSIIRYAMMGPKQIPNLPSWVPDWTSIHSISKNGLEELETVVIYIKSGAKSISTWYTESLGEPLEGNDKLGIPDKNVDDEAQMLERCEKIWSDDQAGAFARKGEFFRFSSRAGSLAVECSLLFQVDQEGRLRSGPPRNCDGPRELTSCAELRGDIFYRSRDGTRLDKEKEICFIPRLGGVFLVKRHQMGNTVSLLGKCSIRTLAISESPNVTKYCLNGMASCKLFDPFNPADMKWYTLQKHTMFAEIYRILSWQVTMSFLAEKRQELAESGNVGHTLSSGSGETTPAKEADNTLHNLQQIWEDVVAKMRLDEKYVKEGRDLGEWCPSRKSIDFISGNFYNLHDWQPKPRPWGTGRWGTKPWETECLRGENETLASCFEHISALRERLMPSLTFEYLVDHVYEFNQFLYENLRYSDWTLQGIDGDWKWKFWVLIKEVLPVLRRPFLDESDLGSLELTRVRLWEQIATLHLIVDLQASSAATTIQINTWAARKHLKEIIIV